MRRTGVGVGEWIHSTQGWRPRWFILDRFLHCFTVETQILYLLHVRQDEGCSKQAVKESDSFVNLASIVYRIYFSTALRGRVIPVCHYSTLFSPEWKRLQPLKGIEINWLSVEDSGSEGSLAYGQHSYRPWVYPTLRPNAISHVGPPCCYERPRQQFHPTENN